MSCESVIRERLKPLKAELAGIPGLWEMFEKCFLNSVETTIQQAPGDTFVITGDIPAMWLRDSAEQVLHYLRFAEEPEVAAMLEGVIARQAECILRDPYANAFNREPSDYKPYEDTPRASDWVWERKYELDSLCYPIWLAEKYLDKTGRTEFLTDRFRQALTRAVGVIRTEQRHEESPYRFTRKNCPPGDTLTREGRGEPVGETGMSWCGFRPSDDACRYGYLVPANLFAARALQGAARLARAMKDEALAGEAEHLAGEIAAGAEAFGKVNHPVFGEIYAYEVDGLGHAFLMDDGNVPSLLSLPYLEACGADSPVYQNTRRFVLSEENLYYFQGKYATGIGSPHTPKGFIWPIALCVQAMTSADSREIAGLLKMLLATHAGTGFMHESFDPDDPGTYTRSWFAWANSMFGDLIYRLHEQGCLAEVLSLAKE